MMEQADIEKRRVVERGVHPAFQKVLDMKLHYEEQGEQSASSSSTPETLEASEDEVLKLLQTMIKDRPSDSMIALVEAKLKLPLMLQSPNLETFKAALIELVRWVNERRQLS